MGRSALYTMVMAPWESRTVNRTDEGCMYVGVHLSFRLYGKAV